MDNNHKKILSCFQDIFHELFLLESIIKLTKECCLEREVSSQYYNISEEKRDWLKNMLNKFVDHQNREFENPYVTKQYQDFNSSFIHCLSPACIQVLLL